MADDAPFPASLCHRCTHCREVRTARSVFLRCAEGTLPKYAPQPVRTCAQFREGSPATEKPEG